MNGKARMRRVLGVGVYLILLGFVLVAVLLSAISSLPAAWEPERGAKWGGTALTGEFMVLVLILLVAGLGSYVHAVTSFVTYVGNRRFRESWTWWYILRPAVGVVLGVLFYFVVRGGLLTLSDEAELDRTGLYFTMGLAALVGLFSKQATDKLQDVANSLFRTAASEGDAARADKLDTIIPVRKAMIPRHQMDVVSMGDDRSEDEMTLQELHGMLSDRVTRIPVLGPNETLAYIIHESVLAKFIADRAMESSGQPTNTDLAQISLRGFLADASVHRRVADAAAFVPPEACLDEVRTEMLKRKNCRDVFVTQSGKADEPVIGWLTNIDIERYCEP